MSDQKSNNFTAANDEHTLDAQHVHLSLQWGVGLAEIISNETLHGGYQYRDPV